MYVDFLHANPQIHVHILISARAFILHHLYLSSSRSQHRYDNLCLQYKIKRPTYHIRPSDNMTVSTLINHFVWVRVGGADIVLVLAHKCFDGRKAITKSCGKSMPKSQWNLYLQIPSMIISITVNYFKYVKMNYNIFDLLF